MKPAAAKSWSNARASRSHDPEARCVNEGVLALVVLAKPPPCCRFLLLSDPMHDEPIILDELIESIEKGHGAPMAVLPPKKRPGFSNDQIGGEHLLGPPETREHPERSTVPSVAGQRPSNPPASVRELHPP
jgi:hypothetical protein